MKRLTTEDFVRKAKEIHGDFYDYSHVVYINNWTKVEIICPTHGTFLQNASNHNSGKGCPECGDQRGASARSSKNYLETAEGVHEGKFDYTSTVYRGASHKITVRCVKHDLYFEQYPKPHLKYNGCPKCKSELATILNTNTTEQFVRKATSAHNGVYDYSLVEYTGYWDKVQIICREHGKFWQTAGMHSSWGNGCPSCAHGGYSTLKPGTLYVLIAENSTKVGITNLTAKKRSEYINYTSPHTFKVYKEYAGLDGKMCYDIEADILRFLRGKYKNPETTFNGYTETFLDVDSEELIRLIEEKLQIS